MRHRFVTADVFTDRVFGGNPLAVFPDAREIAQESMQRIAREFNFSETAFVLPPEDARHARRVRIFTPGVEIPFAGHPTVGTAFVLAAIGAIPLDGPETAIVIEEGVGPVPVTIRAEGSIPCAATLTAPRPVALGPDPPPAADVAAALSLGPDDLLPGFPPAVASCGLPFLFVALVDRGAVRRARIDRPAWERTLARFVAPDIFLFAYDPELPDSDLRARMFAPAFDIAEDPATGSAATALAGLLATRDDARDGVFRWRIEQGFEMGRPSIIDAEAEKRDGAVVSIRVGGRTVLVSEGTMEVP